MPEPAEHRSDHRLEDVDRPEDSTTDLGFVLRERWVDIGRIAVELEVEGRRYDRDADVQGGLGVARSFRHPPLYEQSKRPQAFDGVLRDKICVWCDRVN